MGAAPKQCRYEPIKTCPTVFRFRQNYTLTTGQQTLPVYWWLAGEDDGYRLQRDRVMLVTVDLPRDSYPGTGFGGAFFNLSVNDQVDREACYALLPATERPLGKSVINGAPFLWTSTGGVLNRGTEYGEDVTMLRTEMESVTRSRLERTTSDHSDIPRRLKLILLSLKINSANSQR